MNYKSIVFPCTESSAAFDCGFRRYCFKNIIAIQRKREKEKRGRREERKKFFGVKYTFRLIISFVLCYYLLFFIFLSFLLHRSTAAILLKLQILRSVLLLFPFEERKKCFEAFLGSNRPQPKSIHGCIPIVLCFRRA